MASIGSAGPSALFSYQGAQVYFPNVSVRCIVKHLWTKYPSGLHSAHSSHAGSTNIAIHRNRITPSNSNDDPAYTYPSAKLFQPDVRPLFLE
jgi:hypothetical protein